MSIASISPTAASFVKSLAKPKATDPKSKRLSADLPSIDADITRWLEAKREADRHKSIMDTAHAQIVAAAVPALLGECRKAARLESSIRLNNRLTLTRTSRYCKIAEERIGDIQAVFNGDFSRYFTDRITIALTPEAAADDTVLAQLVATFGEAEFAKRFTVTRELAPTEQFHADITLRADVYAVAEPLLRDETIRGYSPSLKI